MEDLSQEYDVHRCEKKSQLTYNDGSWSLYWNSEESYAVLQAGKQIVKFTDPHITLMDCLEVVGVDNPNINVAFLNTLDYHSNTDLLNSPIRNLPLCHIDIVSGEYTIEYLLVILQKYNALPTLTDIQYNQMHRQVKNAANQVLIGNQGECVWKNHEVLADAGFDVFPLEKDRFGWLVGGIETRHGTVDFG